MLAFLAFCIVSAVHLHNLNSFYGRTSPVVERDSQALINFARYGSLIDQIVTFLQYKQPDPSTLAATSQAALLYLETQLHSIGVDAETDKAFEERSKDLAQKEKELHDRRVLELKALGFSTPGSPGRSRGSSGTASMTGNMVMGMRAR